MNWELWWPNFPILVYFKERQTKPEGQIHFFPVIFVSTKVGSKILRSYVLRCSVLLVSGVVNHLQNGKQLYDVMVERAGPSQNSGPK